MSEYQYYEFQAIDRPLGAMDQQALRALSSRARITATSFTNSYEWGDLKGDPRQMMGRWFDLHLYLANWGSRRLMLRLPKRLVDRGRLDALLWQVEYAELIEAGDNVILDIQRDEVESEGWDDGAGWLAALAPLRDDLLRGDLRMLHLLWLTGVEAEAVPEDAPEPVAGIGPMTGALQAFAEFFGIDPDLVEAAAERSGAPIAIEPDVARRRIAAMPEGDKTALLMRLVEGDPHVGAELRAALRQSAAAPGETPSAARTAGELRARAAAIRLAREQAEAERLAAERQRQAEAAEQERRARLEALIRKGDRVWTEVEAEIERRNAGGYDRATSLLSDLRSVAEARGTLPDFARRLTALRDRHARKERFIERLMAVG
jgi:hypothetical protein